jgi:hypothetical protein
MQKRVHLLNPYGIPCLRCGGWVATWLHHEETWATLVSNRGTPKTNTIHTTHTTHVLHLSCFGGRYCTKLFSHHCQMSWGFSHSLLSFNSKWHSHYSNTSSFDRPQTLIVRDRFFINTPFYHIIRDPWSDMWFYRTAKKQPTEIPEEI